VSEANISRTPPATIPKKNKKNVHEIKEKPYFG
jgi:hypothetical protein